MSARFLFVVGGARSGKSDFAVRAAERFGAAVTFLATATAGDDDMARRIERHQQERPIGWGLVEEPIDLASAVAGVDHRHTLIVDCLTLWVANTLFADHADADIEVAAAELAEALAARSGHSIVVSNEVGLGIHPEHALGRRYRDVLGRVNRTMADRADRSLFLVAGRALELIDPFELIALPVTSRATATGAEVDE